MMLLNIVYYSSYDSMYTHYTNIFKLVMLQFHATDFVFSKWGNSRQADSHGRDTSDKIRKEVPISKMTTKYCTLLF